MKVMTVKKEIKHGSYTQQLMGADDEPTHLHINNHKTNKDSVMIPLSAVNDLLNIK